MAQVFFSSPIQYRLYPNNANTTTNTTYIDAANEYIGMAGKLYIPGATSAKTISAAGGGSLEFRGGSATITFADAGTTIRFGIQDIDPTTGYGDGTYDVYADLVGGTDVISANSDNSIVMESGSKTITSGDNVAIKFEMLSRGGTDQVRLYYSTDVLGVGNGGTPYYIQNTGADSKGNGVGLFNVIFDDGSLGFFYPHPLIKNAWNGYATDNFSSTTEYGVAVRFPYAAIIGGIELKIANIGAGDAHDIVVYSDPYGTPSAVMTESFDGDIKFDSDSPHTYMFSSPVALTADTWYVIAFKPTTGTLSWKSHSGWGSAAQLSLEKKKLGIGDNYMMVNRANSSSAFSNFTTRSVNGTVFVVGMEVSEGGVPYLI